MRIVLASHNRGKLRELTALLVEPRIELSTLDELKLAELAIEETGETFEENARLKAEEVARLTGYPALADDSGLVVDALSGRPGVRSKRYASENATDAENNAHLLRELAGVPPAQRTARFCAVLALAVPIEGAPSGSGVRDVRTVIVAEGALEGHIAEAPRGDNGFGYDPLFVPAGWGERTLGEASSEEKNALSHRSEAAAALAPKLARWLEEQVALSRVGSRD